MKTDMSKKVRLTLVGLDGNAFALLGAFRRAARKQGWTDEEISAVSEKAKSGDYNNLVATLAENCVDADEDEE